MKISNKLLAISCISALTSVSAFANETNITNDNTEVNYYNVAVNFVFGTAFLANVCLNNDCNSSQGAFTQKVLSAKKGDSICVSVIGGINTGGVIRSNYKFVKLDNEPSEINFWGTFMNPKFNFSSETLSYAMNNVTWGKSPCDFN